MTLIRLHDVTKTYQMGNQSQTVLHDVNLSISSGEFIGIMGESGSGKSTMMNIIGLLDTPSSGRYELEGKDVATLTDNQLALLRNKTIGFVFQQFFLLPKLTALENVALPLRYLGESPKLIHRQALSMLEKVGMADRAHHRPSELSGGQQQRVAIARALVCSPSLILADEPTGALDSNTSDEVMSLLRHLHEVEKRTVVIITHNPSIGEACHRCLLIKDGHLERES